MLPEIENVADPDPISPASGLMPDPLNWIEACAGRLISSAMTTLDDVNVVKTRCRETHMECSNRQKATLVETSRAAFWEISKRCAVRALRAQATHR
jgi:hypothetical protein